MLLHDNIVYRPPAVVVKKWGRKSCGSANVEGVVVGQSWQQLIYRNRRVATYFMTLGLNASKESGSLITMMGVGVSISLDVCER
jgi:hypothetical protein